MAVRVAKTSCKLWGFGKRQNPRLGSRNEREDLAWAAAKRRAPLMRLIVNSS